MTKGKWTFKTVSEAVSDSGIKRRGELSVRYPGAYRCALRNGWLKAILKDDFRFGSTHSRRKSVVWTKSACESASRGFSSVGEFRKGCPGGYFKAVRSGWLKSYRWLSGIRRPRNYWTRERCLREAMKYRTMGGFRKGCVSAYLISHRKGWTGDFFWFGSGRMSRGMKINFSK